LLPKLICSDRDKEQISAILERFYRNPCRQYGQEDSEKSTYTPYVDFISAYVQPKAKILDVGSGTWRLPVCIAKKGYRVFGCDFFSSNIPPEFKSAKTDLSCQLITGSGYLLPFKSESFDVVTTLTVLEHIVFVDRFLEEMNRVLKPDGLLIICCPNWAGLNAPIRALISLVFMNKRHWQYEKINDAILGFFRSFIWYFKICFSKSSKFILVAPRLKDGNVDYKESDDDCVHLCHPLSLKRWLKGHNFKILKYNRGYGNSLIAKFFNSLFPSFATINNIVGKK